jgi:enamine deaminase RidA (YjgF/YER057c/UK114 family)
MTIEERLNKMGLTLPEPPKPLGSYVPYVRTGDLVYVSGMLPLKEGKLVCSGRVGESVGLEQAAEAARICAVNALGVLKTAVGRLDRVVRCVKVNGFVASTGEFTDQPKVINGASDFLFEIFGEAGRHARAAVGVNVLPLNSPVEIAFIFEVR